jgi:hypothetical protein
VIVGLYLHDRAAAPGDEERAADQIRRDVVHAPREELPP